MDELIITDRVKILEGLEDLFLVIGDAPKGLFNINQFSASVAPALRWLQLYLPSLFPKLPIWIKLLDAISAKDTKLFREKRVFDGHGISGSTVSVSRYPIYSALLLDDLDLHQGLFVLRALLISALAKGENAWSTRHNPAKKSNTQLVGKLIRFALVRGIGDDSLKLAKGEAVAEILRRISQLSQCDPTSLQTLFDSGFENDLQSFADDLNQKEQDDFKEEISKLVILIRQMLLVFRAVSPEEKVKGHIYRPSAPPRERVRRFAATPIENQDFVNNDGVLNEDAFPTSTLLDICLDELPIRQLTYAREKARAYHSELATELNNQYLPDSWGSLTSVEISAMYELIDVLAKTNPLAALIADLVICTATYADMLPSIRLFSSQTDLNSARSNNFIDLNRGVWIHRVNMPESTYAPKPEEREFLRDVGDWIRLELPKRPLALMKSLVQSGMKSLDELFVAHQRDPKDLIALTVEPLRERFGEHITAGRLAEVLLHRLHLNTNDPVISLFIVGDAYRQIPMQSYYTSVSANRLNAEYVSVLTNMGYAIEVSTDVSTAWVGSKLAPTDGALRGYINFIRDKAKTKLGCVKDLVTLADAHNAFVLYTVKLLQFATGHRDVADPFERLACFLIDEDRAVIVTDKVSQVGLEGRLTWLPDEAINQLNHYLKHIRGLNHRLGRWYAHSPLRGAIKSILNPLGEPLMPLMFFMRPECDDWESVTPSAMKKIDNEYWNLPGNVGRHVLISGLCEQGCPQEYRAYQVGHADRGEQLTSNVSLLSPRDVRDRIVPVLNTIMQKQGWQAINGFRDSNASALQKLRTLEARVFGAKSREIVRVAQSQSRRGIVRETAGRNWPAWKDQVKPLISPSQEIVDRVEGELSAFGGQLAASLVNIFRRWLRVMARKHRWQGAWGRGSLHAMSQIKPSPFSYANASGIQKVRYLRNAFRWYLFQRGNENISTLTPEELCLSFLASALLFDGMINTKYLSDDLVHIVVKRAVRFEHLVWVDLEPVDQPLRRWILHPMTAGLLGQMLKRRIEPNGRVKLQQELPQFLRLISNHHMKSGETQNIDPFSFNKLLKWLHADASTRLPGAVAGYAAGDVNSTSLHLTAWTRLITGASCAVVDEQDKKSIEIPQNLPILNIRWQKQVTEPITEEELSAFQKCLSLASREPTSKGSRRLIKSGLQTVIDRGNSANVLNLMASWGLQLSDPTRDLKGSTILNYLRANLKPLVAECGECSLLALDEFDIEDLYGRVLAYTTKENRPDNAARLRDFHQFLVQAFGANQVDFHEIEPLIGKNSYEVDSNIVTPSESGLLICSLEKAAVKLSPHEGQRLALCAAVFADTGVRASEPFMIRGMDVQVTRIRLRGNTFGNLKTENARRTIALSDDVQTKLHNWMIKRAAHPGFSDREQCLVAVNNTYLKIPKWVVQALKQASGDTKISLRNFRHASLTFSMLAVAGCRRPDAWGLGDGYSTRRSRAFKAMNITWPSRRLSYWVAAQHGHGHPSTSFNNYVHMLDILLFEQAASDFDVSPSEALLLFNLKTAESTRQLISRARKGGRDANSLEIFGKNGNVALVEVISNILKTKKQVNYLSFDLQDKQPDVSLFDIHDILKNSSMGYGVEQLADWMNLPIVLVNKLLKSAKEISHVTQYYPHELNDDNLIEKPDNKIITAARNNKRNLLGGYIKEPLLKVMSDLVNDSSGLSESFVKGLNLWKSGIRLREKGVYLSSLADAKEYIFFLNELGIDRLSIVALVSKGFRSTDGHELALKEWMNELGIENAEFIDRSVQTHFSSALRGYPVGIGIIKNDSIYSQQQVLNYASYLALCTLCSTY